MLASDDTGLQPELLTVLWRIESRGALETAHRALHNSGQVPHHRA